MTRRGDAGGEGREGEGGEGRGGKWDEVRQVLRTVGRPPTGLQTVGRLVSLACIAPSFIKRLVCYVVL